MDFEKIGSQTIDLVRKTGDYIRKEREKFKRESVITKGLHNFVTHVDKAAEERLVSGLEKILPGSGFIAEEGTSTKKGEQYNWVIDPLDGTTNFIHNLPPFAISVALMEHNEIVLGVVLEIRLDECFYAWKGSHAYLNGEIIKVSNATAIKDSLIATGFPYTDFERIGPFLQTLTSFMKTSHGVRRLGSAATDLAYVACGRFEAFYEYGLHPWDVAAGVCILRQAGGKVTDFFGRDDFLYEGEIVASNNLVHDEFLNEIKPFTKNKQK
ncbi:MAG: inositol monophosphatase family protein [Bacteroidota bacterium]